MFIKEEDNSTSLIPMPGVFKTLNGLKKFVLKYQKYSKRKNINVFGVVVFDLEFDKKMGTKKRILE